MRKGILLKYRPAGSKVPHGADRFAECAGDLVHMLRDAGQARLPSGQQYQRRARSLAEGIVISRGDHDALLALAERGARQTG